jgi:hypothetical protein
MPSLPSPKVLAIPALWAVVAGPALASGQADRCLGERGQDQLIGALIGAGVGAIVGNTASHGRVGATLGGGAGGAALGAVAGGASARCGQNRYGYYDDAGRWISYRATAYGYTDPDGRWIDRPPAEPTAMDDGESGRRFEDTRAREQLLAAQLERAMNAGAISQRDGGRALRDLRDIGATDAAYRSGDGRLSAAQRQDIDARLAALAQRFSLRADASPRSGTP